MKSVNKEPLKILKKAFSELSCRVQTRSYDKSKVELPLIETFNKLTNAYKAIPIEEYLRKFDVKWSPYLDSCYGDAVITSEDGDSILVDFKVGEKYYGPIQSISLTNFGSDPEKLKCFDAAYYFCGNGLGDSRVVEHDNLLKKVKECQNGTYPFLSTKEKSGIINPMFNVDCYDYIGGVFLKNNDIGF